MKGGGGWLGGEWGAFKEILCYFTGNMPTCLLRYLCINNHKWAWLADCNCNIARLGIWFITVKLYYSRFIDIFFCSLCNYSNQNLQCYLCNLCTYMNCTYILWLLVLWKLKFNQNIKNFGVDIYCQKYFPFLI